MDPSIVKRLTINGRTRRVVPTEETDLTKIRDQSGTDYVLLCLDGALNQANKQALIKAGVKDLEYVGEDVYYLGEYTLNNLEPVQNLKFVLGVDVYRRDFKITNELEAAIKEATKRNDKDAVLDLQLALHSTRTASIDETVDQLTAVAGVGRSNVTVDKIGGVVTMRAVKATNIEKLAEVDAVRTMHQVITRSVTNDRARAILGLEYAQVNLPYQGENQKIIIADTGLDVGKDAGLHPAFKDRVLEFIPVGRTHSLNCDDPIGHGTHVCGSALGAPLRDRPGFEHVQGTAPKAKLVMQSLLKSDGTLETPTGQPLYDLFVQPHKEHGACIHSNSWGVAQWTGSQASYSPLEAQQVDRAVWENPNLLIIVAAGNFGHMSRGAQIAGVAACKNVLTVGATDSTRPSIQGEPVPTKLSDNDPTEVGYYSSRGPTLEERIKPDVLAPGSAILSTRTQAVKNLGPNYTSSEDKLFCYTFGTSMATPLVAGCAAVIREYLDTIRVPDPPAALIKALFINGAYSYHHPHSAAEGFGMVNVANSLLPQDSPTGGFSFDGSFTDVNQAHTIDVKIDLKVDTSSNSEPTGPVPIDPGNISFLRVSPPSRKGSTLKVTMVYTDFPGASLQNDLTLSVTASDKSVRKGNRGSSSAADSFNNVEQVVWKGITPGTATIGVLCNRLTEAPQPYALVWRLIPNED